MLVAGEDHPAGPRAPRLILVLEPSSVRRHDDRWGVPRGGERRAARSFEAVQPGLAAVPSREQAAPWRISVGGQDTDLAW
jgi:hypothetical protein